MGRDLGAEPLVARVRLVAPPYAGAALVAGGLGQHVAEDPVEPGAALGGGLGPVRFVGGAVGTGHAQSPSCSARSWAAAICSGVFGFLPCPGTLPALIASPVYFLASGSSLASCSQSLSAVSSQ